MNQVTPMPTVTALAPRLTHLPYELLVNIFNRMSPADLFNLRQCCRSFNVVIIHSDALVEAWNRPILREYWFDIEREGLQSRLPSLLAPGLIKSLRFDHLCIMWYSLTQACLIHNPRPKINIVIPSLHNPRSGADHRNLQQFLSHTVLMLFDLHANSTQVIDQGGDLLDVVDVQGKHESLLLILKKGGLVEIPISRSVNRVANAGERPRSFTFIPGKLNLDKAFTGTIPMIREANCYSICLGTDSFNNVYIGDFGGTQPVWWNQTGSNPPNSISFANWSQWVFPPPHPMWLDVSIKNTATGSFETLRLRTFSDKKGCCSLYLGGADKEISWSPQTPAYEGFIALAFDKSTAQLLCAGSNRIYYLRLFTNQIMELKSEPFEFGRRHFLSSSKSEDEVCRFHEVRFTDIERPDPNKNRSSWTASIQRLRWFVQRPKILNSGMTPDKSD